MKKILCALLTAIIMVTMVCPVMATNVGSSDVTNLFQKLETMIPSDAMERVQVWKTFKAYMLDGTNGIDTIIKAVKGQITLNTEGELPENCRILLSDCYLDRLNFMPNRRAEGYDEVIGTPYLAISPKAVGCWNISWDDTSVTVSVNGEIVKCLSKNDSKGYNHLTVLFEGEGELLLTHFAAHSEAMNWDTGIEY